MGPAERLANHITNQFFGLTTKVPTDFKQTIRQQKIIAHRGVHQNGLAQENTLKAFDLALENKLWGIEFDIQWTNDTVPVIHHDAHLGQHFAKPNIRIDAISFRELHQLAPAIPTLQQVVDRFGKRLHFMIELKTSADTEQKRQSLQTALAGLMPIIDYHFMSLRPEPLDSITWLDPKALIDIAWFNVIPSLNNAIQKGHGGVAGHIVLMNSKISKIAKKHQISLGTGYIENQGTLYRENQRRIDWFFTDTPLDLFSP